MILNKSEKLSHQLLKIVLTVYFSITIIMTLLHMYTEYKYTMQNVVAELKILEKTYKPALIRSIWELNTLQTKAIAQGIINLPSVTGVIIKEAEGKIIDVRGEVSQSELSHEFLIEYHSSDFNKVIGEAILYTNNQVIFDRIKVGFYLIVVNALVKSLILIFLFLIIFNKMLTRPLNALSDEVEDIKLDNIEGRSISIPQTQNNELTLFKDTFNSMLSTISNDLKEKNKLLKEIEEEAFVNNFFAKTASDLIDIESYEEIYDIILKRSQQMTNSPFGFVGYIDEETGYLVCPTLTEEIWKDCNISKKNVVFEKFAGLWGWVLNNKKPLFTNDPKNDPRSSGTPVGHIPIDRFISVPVFIGTKLIGQISLANSDKEYSLKDIENLEWMANLYAFSFQKKRLNDKRIEQEELIYQSRNDAMSEILSMISHQWRQPLQIIAINNNNLQADMAIGNIDNEVIQEYCTAIEKYIEYLSNTIINFQNFFQPSSIKEQEVDLRNIMDSTLDIIGKTLENKNITVIKEYMDIKMIETYPREIFQVFINLLKNAEDILIQRDIADKKIWITILENKNGFIDITIEDNAGGIELDNINKIFEPYFTTKHSSIGKGLSLYISKITVEKNLKGNIYVKNSSHGAKFNISLPIN